jgi:hypothetical protein
MLIGSHNSGTYKFNFDISFWNNDSKWELLRKTAKLLPCIRNKIISISKCQNLTILEQLYLGINFLDFRISQSNDIFYISHTFCCMPLIDVLEQIKIYLDEMYSDIDIIIHPILLLIQPDFSNIHTLINKEELLLNYIKTYFGSYLNESKLIIYYKPINININVYPEFHNMNMINSIWYNIDNVSDFIKKFNETEFKKYDGLYCILTPLIDEYKWYKLFSIKIKNYAIQLNPIIISLIKDRITQKKSIPSFLLFDYIDKNLIQDFKKLN